MRLALPSFLILVLLVACGGGAFTGPCEESRTCPLDPDAGDGCDRAASPKDTQCLLDEARAVFVSPAGSDSASGTKAAPLATLGAALRTGKVVIACEGTFEEAIVLDAGRDGAHVAGGFDCGSWTFASKKTSVKPKELGPALTARALSNGAILEDLEILAKDAAAPGESSLGALSVDSVLTLRRVRIAAGAGAKGTDGALVPVTFPTEPQLRGPAANGDTPAEPKTCGVELCPAGGTTSGGKGGAALNGNGTKGAPDFGGGGAGTGGVACSNGAIGGAAPAAVDGPGGMSAGALDGDKGWLPKRGTDGSPGVPGQGGGGGGGGSGIGAGGGGGCGGCGGAAGKGGAGGGASIAIAAIGGTLTVVESELYAGAGGAGGAGSPGQTGMTSGGNGGFPDGAGGCQGGRGGAGGTGGAGGGGVGGISAGIVYRGTAVTTSGGKFAPGLGGKGGAGGKPSNAGVDGLSVGQLEVQ